MLRDAIASKHERISTFRALNKYLFGNTDWLKIPALAPISIHSQRKNANNKIYNIGATTITGNSV